MTHWISMDDTDIQYTHTRIREEGRHSWRLLAGRDLTHATLKIPIEPVAK